MNVSDYTPRFPLFCDLRNKRVVVAGAGEVACRKIETLLSHGAVPFVVAPEAAAAVRKLAREGRIRLELREFEPLDVKGAFLVVGATGDTQVNRAVAICAERENALVNIVDCPELCNCFVPSVVRRGPLQIAISTSGAAPGLAKELRRQLERQFGPAWERYVLLLGQLRDLTKRTWPDERAVRHRLFNSFLRPELRERIVRDGEEPQAIEVFDEAQNMLGLHSDKDGVRWL